MKEKLTIVKVGGKIVEEADTLSQLLADFSAIPGYKLLDWSFGGQHKNAEIRKEEILNDPSYQTVSAVQTGKVVIVPMKYMHCSSQYVMKNLEELKRIMRTTL